MQERGYLIALYSFLSFGPARCKLLINYFGSSREVWNARESDLQKVNISSQIVSKFAAYRSSFNFKNYFDDLRSKNIGVLTQSDTEYPENLKLVTDAPLVLYIRGILKKSDANAVAIVGSRKMTSYGREVTERFAQELSQLGITIVSGLAFGVDVFAHNSALNAGGRCIAVLAGGVDEITPRSNDWLGRSILSKKSGAIISEFPPGTMPQKHFFPFRNRIISGLSKAVIVVEGAIKSGTLHTVSHALDQGRQVFAVPGPITSPMSEGPNYLIKNGSKLLTETKDIIEELNLQLNVDYDSMQRVMPDSPEEKDIANILTAENLHIDEASRILGLTVSEISATLTIMELKGIVKNIGNGVYKKC